jgi:lysophospholipase L1-like esterase
VVHPGKNARLVALRLGLAALVACKAFGLLLAADAAGIPISSDGKDQWVSASDPRFLYSGRFDFSNPLRPVVIWEASTIAVDFDGDRVSVRFMDATDQAFFDASVDGRSSVLALRKGMPGQTISLQVTGSGLHHLVLFKRSEATAGTVGFGGILIAQGAHILAPATPKPLMKIEIFGDSITAGACDEDGDKDQWEDRSTHNAAFSWAAVTAAAFSADYRNISVSGIGLATGYVDIVMGQIWDRIYPSPSSTRVEAGQWIPDVVLILLGDNDDSYPRDKKLPFPINFGEKYAALVQAIRSAYPKAHIVLLNGGMWAGIHSEFLVREWTAVVSRLESGDPAISHFVFAHWTSNHPRIADHRILAGELIGWLKTQPFMNAHPITPR